MQFGRVMTSRTGCGSRRSAVRHDPGVVTWSGDSLLRRRFNTGASDAIRSSRRSTCGVCRARKAGSPAHSVNSDARPGGPAAAPAAELRLKARKTHDDCVGEGGVWRATAADLPAIDAQDDGVAMRVKRVRKRATKKRGTPPPVPDGARAGTPSLIGVSAPGAIGAEIRSANRGNNTPFTRLNARHSMLVRCAT